MTPCIFVTSYQNKWGVSSGLICCRLLYLHTPHSKMSALPFFLPFFPLTLSYGALSCLMTQLTIEFTICVTWWQVSGLITQDCSWLSGRPDRHYCHCFFLSLITPLVNKVSNVMPNLRKLRLISVSISKPLQIAIIIKYRWSPWKYIYPYFKMFWSFLQLTFRLCPTCCILLWRT